MTGTIFDFVESEIPEGQEGYFEIAKRSPEPKDDSYFNTVKDYAKTFLKGSAEGINKFGNIMGGIQDIHGIPKQEKEQEFTEKLDELLPNEEGYIQKSIRKGLGEAPSVIGMPIGGTALQTGSRAMLAGFAGEGAKELGLPEWAQSAAEITAYIGPDITKKLLSSGSNKEIIEAGKKFGLSDEQITPLIQSEFKQKWLSKLSPRRGSTEKALHSTKDQLSKSYGNIASSEQALMPLHQQNSEKLVQSIDDILFEMPSGVREKIKADYSDLLSKNVTGQTLINFWTDINHNLSGSTKQLSLLKEPIKQALNSVSPELAKDFDMINSLYSKYYAISSKLKPNITSDIIKAGEALSGIGALGSALMGNYLPLAGILGEQGARKTAQQLLLNPHLQQLSEKIVIALNDNKAGVAKKLIESYSNQMEKHSPEFSKELRKISMEDLEKLLNQKESKE